MGASEVCRSRGTRGILGRSRARCGGLGFLMACREAGLRASRVSESQKTHPAKIRPDGAPASRLFGVGRVAAGPPATEYRGKLPSGLRGRLSQRLADGTNVSLEV
jgi:hypothetical protein